MHAAKTLGWAGATPLLGAFSRPKFRGIAPARPELLGPCFGRVQESEQQFVMQAVMIHGWRKGERKLGTSESTVKATEDYNPSGPSGGGSQKQPEQVRRVH